MNDKITKIKLSEALTILTPLQGKVVKDKHVVALMRYYELIKEIKNVKTIKVSKLKESIRHLVLQELNEQENDKPEHFGGGENIDILGFKTEHFDI